MFIIPQFDFYYFICPILALFFFLVRCTFLFSHVCPTVDPFVFFFLYFDLLLIISDFCVQLLSSYISNLLALVLRFPQVFPYSIAILLSYFLFMFCNILLLLSFFSNVSSCVLKPRLLWYYTLLFAT
jgi:hypothetical protein